MNKQEQTDKQYYDYLQSAKWKKIAYQRMEIDNFTCQGCGTKGNAMNPLQVHHVNYYHIFHEEGHIYDSLITVCRSCHCVAHNIMNRITSKDGLRGWKMNPNIPTVNTLTLSGLDLQTRKGNLNNAKAESD